MRSLVRVLGLGLRRAAPPALKARIPASLKARVRRLPLSRPTRQAIHACTKGPALPSAVGEHAVRA